MSTGVFRIGLHSQRGALNLSTTTFSRPIRQYVQSIILGTRQISIQTSSRPSTLQHKVPPATTSSLSSFFTPSICKTVLFVQTRYASTARQHSPTSNGMLDWNTFFTLRTSRRRFSLASSIVSSAAVTTGAFLFLSTQPELADEITKLIPTDPVISMGLLTFAAMFLGWLIGPIFGNTAWKLLNRSKILEFTAKERAFFDRIKKHRVNPMGASTNNPVPDFYGEKIGSVQGYRRWLKDQRAFNRKREGQYPGGI